MSIAITWSATNGGVAITSLNHGNGAAGATLTEQEIFIEHNASNVLTQCKFYFGGNATDLAEMIEWGDAALTADFGGIQINMNALGSYASWPTFASKSPSGADSHTIRTGFGDTVTTGIVLAQEMGLVSAGIMQTGTSPNIRFKMRIVVPSSEAVTGARTVEQKLRFTYTS